MGLVMALALACGACSVHPDITPQERAMGQSFTPPAGKGVLYVYRPSTPRAMLTGRPVFINDKELNSNNNGTFMAIPLKPGNYRIQAALKPITDEQQGHYPEINLSVKAGKNYFIRQSVEGSIFGEGKGDVMLLQTGAAPIPIPMGTSTLLPFKARLVSEATGKQECRGLKQVGADPYIE